mgnify:FL=1|jgi:DNA-directed RNA polymerase specialized sigma24 family protein
MLYEVDSYTLEYDENTNKYYISFMDSAKNNCRVQIDKEIFDIYMTSKKSYTKIKNETSRHLEHSDLSEMDIYKRSFQQPSSVEDVVIKNIETEKLGKALGTLTDTQYRRIELHIINEITIRGIADIEKVKKNQVEKSLKLGLKKIKKFLEE